MNVNPMLKSRLRTLSGLILVWLASPLPAQELDARSVEFLKQTSVHFWCAHCYECHSDDAAIAGKLEGDLRLDNRAGVQQGGASGPVIVPGKPDESVLIKSVRYTDKALQMPPQEPLSAEQIGILEKWVGMGAGSAREEYVGGCGKTWH